MHRISPVIGTREYSRWEGPNRGWLHTYLSHRVRPLVGMGFENGATIGLADKLEGSSPIEIFIQLKTFTIRGRLRQGFQSFEQNNC